MNNLSREKKSQLVLVAMITITLCSGIYFGIIQGQVERIRAMEARRTEMADKLAKAERALKNKAGLEAELAARRSELADIERTMAGGDLYAWIIGVMSRRATEYHINIPTYGRESIGEVGIIPVFPYKTATFVIRGTGRFEDLGRFIAGLENDFPFFRVQNLGMAQSGPVDGRDYQVQFNFELVVPVRPTSATLAQDETNPAAGR